MKCEEIRLGGLTLKELAKIPRKKRAAIILKAMRDVLKPRAGAARKG